ncbi:MAG: hypothetical protein JXB30_08130 [Anaerolineae bacterium]|nr:hypothetical protein [Anaerolineae bacterium]
MDYTITFYKRPGVQPHPRELLYAIWIDTPGIKPQPGTVWQVVQRMEVTTEVPIPPVLCGLLLMSETTGDRLFRQITDTWLGPVEDDPLDDYDRYASRGEAMESFDKAYPDRLNTL